MCNPVKSILGAKPQQADQAAAPAQAVVVGAPPVVATPIGDTGADAAVAKKPKSLLSSAGAAGDLGGAQVGYSALKPTLGA